MDEKILEMIDNLVKSLVEAGQVQSSMSDSFKKSMTDFIAKANNARIAFDTLEKTLNKVKNINESSIDSETKKIATAKKRIDVEDQVADAQKKLYKELVNGEKTSKDYNDAMTELQHVVSKSNVITSNTFSKLRGLSERQVQEETKKELAERGLNQLRQSQIGKFGQGTAKVVDMMTNAAVSLAGQIRKIYSDTSQTGAATSLFNSVMAATTSTTEKVGEGLTKFGGAIAGNAKGWGTILGGVIGGIGATVSVVSAAARKLAEAVLPILADAIEKNITGFQKLSTMGGVFAGGMTEMRAVASDARLTLDQLANTVANSREAIAQMGLGIGEGTKRVARALQAGGDGFRTNLLNLGYTIEEQGSLVAETMAMMRQSGQKLSASDPQVIEQTKKYAESLRLIADITGEDAKKRMASAQEAANELAFQQKLAGMSEEQRKGITEAMAGMTKAEQKAFMETIVFGQAVTQETAAALAQIPALGEKVKSAADLALKGSLNAETFAGLGKSFNEEIRKQVLGQTGIAQAAMAGVDGIVGSIKGILQEQLKAVKVQSPEAIENALKAIGSAAKGADDFTKAAVDLMKVNQDAKLAVDKLLSPKILGAYSSFVATSVKQVEKAVKSFVDYVNTLTGKKTPKTEEEKRKAITDRNVTSVGTGFVSGRDPTKDILVGDRSAGGYKNLEAALKKAGPAGEQQVLDKQQELIGNVISTLKKKLESDNLSAVEKRNASFRLKSAEQRLARLNAFIDKRPTAGDAADAEEGLDQEKQLKANDKRSFWQRSMPKFLGGKDLGYEPLEKGLPQGAKGGIFSGPVSGYPVQLHGKEAVIPMPNDVTKESLSRMNESDRRDAIQKMAESQIGLQNIAEALQEHKEPSIVMVRLLTQLNQNIQELVTSSKEVATNTDKAAKLLA